MKNKKYIYSFTALAILATLGFATLASAQTTTTTTPTPGNSAWGHSRGNGRGLGGGMMKPGVFGTVTAVSGNIITVTSTHRTGPKPAQGSTPSTSSGQATTTTIYTVDTTSATITKNNVAGTIASIIVGDTIMAQGTLTGTNLVATTIRDGVMMRTPGANGQPVGTGATSPFTGNGQPVTAGTI